MFVAMVNVHVCVLENLRLLKGTKRINLRSHRLGSLLADVYSEGAVSMENSHSTPSDRDTFWTLTTKFCETGLYTSLSLPSSKRIFSQPFKDQCISAVVRIGSIIIFHLSMKGQVLHTVWYHISGEAAGEILNTLGTERVKNISLQHFLQQSCILADQSWLCFQESVKKPLSVSDLTSVNFVFNHRMQRSVAQY